MAAPTVAGSAAGGQTSAVDPWSFGLAYGTPAAGDLLIVIARTAGAQTVSGVSTNSLALTNFATSTADATDDQTTGWYRQCTGTETTNIDVDLSAAAKGAIVVYRITGHEDPATQQPEEFEATGTGANPDPPNATPTGGSKDYLWIAFCGADGEMADATAPTNYNNSFVAANSGTGGAVATNCRVGAGTRTLTASSENPGAFTLGAASNGWTAWTIAVHPPSAPSFAPPPTSHYRKIAHLLNR